MGLSTLALFALLHSPVAAVATWDAATIVQDPAKAEVFIMGMTHGTHRTSTNWGLDHVEEAIRRINPDVIVTEIPPDRFDAALAGWARDGRISEPRVARFPEYTDVVFPLQAELRFIIEPAAAWTAEMNNLRKERIQAFETEAAHAERFSEYTARVAAVEATHAQNPIDTDDPFVIHSEAYDRRTEEALEPYDTFLNDWIGEGGWTNINRAHAELVEQAILRHPGKRILVTFGAGHKYWLRRYLAERDFQIMDITPHLPTTADLPQPVRAERAVRDLHRFFEEWFLGTLPNTDEAFRRFSDAMGEGFVMVSPTGNSVERPDLVEGLRAAHAHQRGANSPYAIRVENVQVRGLGAGYLLVRYEEWQDANGSTKGRQSSAVLLEDAKAPGGFSWIHVHETWLP